jgi:hypothetical protein
MVQTQADLTLFQLAPEMALGHTITLVIMGFGGLPVMQEGERLTSAN